VLITEITAQLCDVRSSDHSCTSCFRTQYVRLFTHNKHSQVKLQSVRWIFST